MIYLLKNEQTVSCQVPPPDDHLSTTLCLAVPRRNTQVTTSFRDKKNTRGETENIKDLDSFPRSTLLTSPHLTPNPLLKANRLSALGHACHKSSPSSPLPPRTHASPRGPKGKDTQHRLGMESQPARGNHIPHNSTGKTKAVVTHGGTWTKTKPVMTT